MSLKLVFYSGGQTARNRRVHQALADLVPARPGRGKSLTYFPYHRESAEYYFARAKKRYSPYGFKQFHWLSVDSDFSKSDLERALDSDVIYLAGGNTFYFLHQLRRSGLLPKLRQYARSGGVLAGLSAGAILLTPTIGLAGYPRFDADENEVGLRELRALNLVPFEVYPHYQNRDRVIRAMKRYSRRCLTDVYGIEDGCGIVVQGSVIETIGNVYFFSKDGT